MFGAHLRFCGAKAEAVPFRTSFHMGSPDFELKTFVSIPLLPPWKPFT